MKKLVDCRMLYDGSIETHEFENQPYSEMLQTVFQYANRGETDEAGISFTFSDVDAIENITRRVLEAFSTFQYKTGTSELITDEEVLSGLNSDQQAYFKTLMYRLVLNGESHQKEAVYSFEGVAFPEMLTIEERRNTAQDVLCLMHSLQKTNVIRHLCVHESTVNEGICRTLDEWMAERNL